MLNQFICGDAEEEELRRMPKESVDTIITSPPYYLKRKYFVGDKEIGIERTFEDYIKRLGIIFGMYGWDVLKPSGNMFIVVGDYYDRKTHSLVGIPEYLHVRLSEYGLIRRHRIIWEKPNGKTNGSKIHKRLHNNTEIILHYTKTSRIPQMYFNVPLVNASPATIKQYQKYYGGKARKDYEIHGAMNPSDTKRNIIKRKFAPWGGNKNVGVPEVPNNMYSGNEYIPADKSIDGSVWRIPHPTRNTVKHYAMFPEPLVNKLLLAGCPEGGVVLDPFMGAGTVAVCALKLNRNFIGIELNKKYVEISEERIKNL